MSKLLANEDFSYLDTWVPVPDVKPEFSWQITFQDWLTIDGYNSVSNIDFSFIDQGSVPAGIPPTTKTGSIRGSTTKLTVGGHSIVRERDVGTATGLFTVSGTPGIPCVVTITVMEAGQFVLKAF